MNNNSPRKWAVSALLMGAVILASATGTQSQSAGFTDKSEEATIGDPDERATIGDPGEQATIGDPGEKATIGDPGEQATIGDPGEQAGIGDPGEQATIGDPGEQATIGDPGEQAGIGDPGEAAGIGDPGERNSFWSALHGPEECTDYEERDMKQSVILLMILTMAGPLSAFAATLQNTDSQAYDLQIQESGRPFSSQYQVIENAQVDICFNGCEMTLLSTGQTVRVNPKDTVAIDNGVMNVTSGNWYGPSGISEQAVLPHIIESRRSWLENHICGCLQFCRRADSW
jgi:hypothetical protein